LARIVKQCPLPCYTADIKKLLKDLLGIEREPDWILAYLLGLFALVAAVGLFGVI
jgi:hypothetical protein